MPSAESSPSVRYTHHRGSLWSSSAPFSSSNKVQRSLPAAARFSSQTFIGSNAPVQARWAHARRAGPAPPNPPTVACNRLLGGSLHSFLHRRLDGRELLLQDHLLL